MRLVDANVLLSSVARSSGQHRTAQRWLDAALSGPETVLLPWVSLLAFVRVATHRRIFDAPLDTGTAFDVVDGWLGRPNTTVPEPDARHPRRVRELLEAAGGRGGNLVNDAHLAALALQWGATVVTFDRDFGRFPGVRWELPAP